MCCFSPQTAAASQLEVPHAQAQLALRKKQHGDVWALIKRVAPDGVGGGGGGAAGGLGIDAAAAAAAGVDLAEARRKAEENSAAELAEFRAQASPVPRRFFLAVGSLRLRSRARPGGWRRATRGQRACVASRAVRAARVQD